MTKDTTAAMLARAMEPPTAETVARLTSNLRMAEARVGMPWAQASWALAAGSLRETSNVSALCWAAQVCKRVMGAVP